VRPTDFLRSTTFRLSLLSVAFFVCAGAVVFWLNDLATSNAFYRELDEAIIAEFSELEKEAGEQGIGEIVHDIEMRLSDVAGADSHYVLLDQFGARLAGDLPIVSPQPGWSRVSLAAAPDSPNGPIIRVLGERIADGAFLAVGRDRTAWYRLRSIRTRIYIIIGASAFVLIFASKLFVTSMVTSRLGAINSAATDIMRGDLSRRIPITRRNDEFDEVAKRLNATFDRIAMLMGQVRQVTDDIAHDLRTPLARLRQRLYLARRKARSLEEYEDAVDGAIAQADGIIDTFASLLRIAQVESGARRSAFRVLDLSAVADSLVETYGPVAEDQDQHLRGQIEPGIPAFGDQELLHQLLANLIENALNHTPPGSRIVIRLARDGSGALAEIIDNGPGIPAAMRAEVFKRFVRLDKSRSKPGNGLGLSLVAAIAELHQVTVELSDANPGEQPPGLRAAVLCPAPTVLSAVEQPPSANL